MAFAIVHIAGTQEKAVKGAKLSVPYMDAQKEGDAVTFGDVLLLSDGKGDVKIGHPYINGAVVEAKVLGSSQGEKIRVFKMKKRKRLRRTIGHRQQFTEIEVTAVRG